MALVIAEISRFSSACSFFSMLISHSASIVYSHYRFAINLGALILLRNKSISNNLGANPNFYEDHNSHFNANKTYCYAVVGCSFSILAVMRNMLIVRKTLMNTNVQAEQK